MTPDQTDLARRAIACRRWRWLPGMLWSIGPAPRWVRASTGRVQGSHEDGGPVSAPRSCVPDLADPATLGCLLALVREAWGDPRLVAIYCEAANPGQSEGWAVQGADNRMPLAGEDYPSEAAALVAALEAAP